MSESNRVWVQGDMVGFHCPGCGCTHGCTHGVNSGWTFNGDLVRPTISPSILVNGAKESAELPRCHSFVKDGRIEFLSDCDHDLAGQTVDLPLDE